MKHPHIKVSCPVCQHRFAVRREHWISGHTKTCGGQGCKATQTHGLSRSPEYKAWQAMRQRCYNVADKKYLDYGARGIRVCWEWMDSFEAFFKDMGFRPSSNHSLDRRDNEGHYRPGNCRWATSRQQARNRRPRLSAARGAFKQVLSNMKGR